MPLCCSCFFLPLEIVLWKVMTTPVWSKTWSNRTSSSDVNISNNSSKTLNRIFNVWHHVFLDSITLSQNLGHCFPIKSLKKSSKETENSSCLWGRETGRMGNKDRSENFYSFFHFFGSLGFVLMLFVFKTTWKLYTVKKEINLKILFREGT